MLHFPLARFATDEQLPEWQAKRESWKLFAQKTGHNLGRVRSCMDMHDWLGRLQPILIPRLKLAFCYIPKIACTQFKDLFNTVNDLNASLGWSGFWQASMSPALGINMSNVTRANGWRFAAFTRDPLERYFSTYGSTCVERDTGGFDHDLECCGKLVDRNTSQRALAANFALRALSDAALGLPYEEQHWQPQVQLLWNCGWERFSPDRLDFRGNMSAGGMNRQVKEMLRMVNATEDDMKTVDRFFPEGRREGRTNPIKGDAKDFYAQDTIDAVKFVYAADYALL